MSFADRSRPQGQRPQPQGQSQPQSQSPHRRQGVDSVIHKPPTGGLLSLLVVLVSISALIPATFLLADLLHFYATASSGLPVPVEQAESLRATMVRESLQTGLLILGAVIALALWSARAAHNTHNLRVADHGLSSAAVAAGFLLPLYHWIKPYQILTTLWKTSDEDAYPGDLTAWRGAPSSFMLTLWWICWLLCLVSATWLAVLLATTSGPAEDVPMFFDLAFYSVLAAIPLLLLNMVVTRSVDRRQVERWHTVRAFVLKRQRGGMDVSGIYQRPDLTPPDEEIPAGGTTAADDDVLAAEILRPPD